MNPHSTDGTVEVDGILDQLQLGQSESTLALRQAWERIQDMLKERVNKPSYQSWVRTVVPVSLENGIATFATSSRFAKHWFEAKHIDAIRDALAKELGEDIRVRFEVLDPRQAEESPLLAEALPERPSRQNLTPDEEPFSLPLNKRYTLDTFVVGPGNRLAFAAAAAVADSPGRTYNPLFIYGNPGLGKTHLLHAIGHRVREIAPEMNVAYLSGEAFTYHYVTAIREHKIQAFRRRCRAIDVWLLDDVQFLIGKERTEEEFFHTFNAIYDSGKQIVLSSDRPPRDLALDRRLLSRFESGLVTDIAPPDLETRMAILQRKAESEQMSLPDEVVIYIAKIIRSNIRQLEGALVKLHAYASLMRMPLTTDLAKEVLHAYYTEEPEIDPRAVQLEVCRFYNVDLEEMNGPARTRHVALARQVAMYLARELTSASLTAIGRAFGGRDHSTVLHACQKIAECSASDPKLAASISDVRARLKNGCG